MSLSAPRRSFESILLHIWMQRGLAASMLWPLSLIFRLLTAARRATYRCGLLRTHALPVPVIVVGNVFVGGTGKTPFTLWLVETLRAAGYVPGVISRGYGAADALPQTVQADSDPRRVGDEPVLIAQRAGCPVMVGRRRAAAAAALLVAHPQVNLIIADDGLQHYALRRDIEIVLFDQRGVGNGWLLPAGPLREPAARRRDFTVVNGTAFPPGMPDDAVAMQVTGSYAERLSDRTQHRPLSALGDGNSKVAAAAGIGNPARFFAMLRSSGLQFQEFPLPDHFDFIQNPFADTDADVILITEKDAVKCARIDTLKNDPRLWVVPVTAHIEPHLAEKIVEKCRGYSTA